MTNKLFTWGIQKKMFEQYKEAIENSNIVSKTDVKGIITFVNDEFCKISGYSCDELLGKNHNIVRHPDVSTQTFRKLWDTILAKKTYRSTVKNLAKNGRTFYVNTTITPILDENGEIEEFIAIRYDVTKEVELKLALEEKEKELIELNRTLEHRVRKQTKKLIELNLNLEKRVKEEIEKNEQKQKILFMQSRFASLGQMIANIAHQWRQPLTELNLTLFALKNAIGDIEKRERYAEAKNTIQSMSQTIEDFQNFFNPNKNVEPFDPTVCFKDAMSLIRNDLQKAGISVHSALGKQIEIVGVSNELTQTIINLIQNAKEALLNSFTEKKEIFVAISDEGENIEISVQDNAGGIDEKIIDKIFDPYFTTKHASRGTGLGLFMSRMIVQQSLGGIIEVKNYASGALFVIKIPKRSNRK